MLPFSLTFCSPCVNTCLPLGNAQAPSCRDHTLLTCKTVAARTRWPTGVSGDRPGHLPLRANRLPFPFSNLCCLAQAWAGPPCRSLAFQVCFQDCSCLALRRAESWLRLEVQRDKPAWLMNRQMASSLLSPSGVTNHGKRLTFPQAPTHWQRRGVGC